MTSSKEYLKWQIKRPRIMKFNRKAGETSAVLHVCGLESVGHSGVPRVAPSRV